MGIIKQAKKLSIVITNNHLLMAGKVERTAETVKIVATYGHIELNSMKKIEKNGNIG